MNHSSSYKVFFMPTRQYKPSLVVLAGRSGSGKSAVLKHLAQQGYPVIDLERMARHGGSAFGHLPFGNVPVDNMGFLKSLHKAVEAYKYEPLVFTECKAASLGNALLPEIFVERLRNGYIVHFDVTLENRINYLADAYQHITPEMFWKSAQKLEGKLSATELAQIQTFSNAHDYKAAIRVLLKYYDTSTAYNYFINHAHITISITEIDPPVMVEKLTQALMEQHPLFLHCG